MKKTILSLMLALLSLSSLMAAQPVIKIDINEASRKDEETTEPGFSSWKFGKDKVADSITMEGVEMVLRGRMVTRYEGVVYVDEECACRSSWSKALVQSPNYHRLQGDGLVLEPTSMTGAIELVFKNLPVGTHTFQSYHNTWDAPNKKEPYPMDVYVDGELIYENLMRTQQAPAYTDALIVKLSLNVKKAGQQVVVRFETNPNYEQKTSYSGECSPVLNGFELNTVAVDAKASKPVPADADMHIDADQGHYTLQWTAAGNAVKHHIYLGTSKDNLDLVATQVAADTSLVLNNLTALNTYYWRVDEEDASGVVSAGEVWSFRPRHLAFIGAEGYGRYAHGGRGGKVVYVTNLNDSGEGSFRQAATSGDGPRTIMFAVSGIIPLESRLVIDENVTIAGQTAPGKGICFRKRPIGLGHDNIMRFIRLRLGHGPTADGIGMGGVSEGIMDHCSISWTIDEAFSSRNAKNITLQRTLISEALSIAGHKNYEEGTDHGFAGSISGDIGSFHHNLLAHNSGRNWSLAGGLDGSGYLQGRLDIFNMVVYNWSRHACYNGAHEVNFVNNYYKRGPATNQTNATKVMLSADPPGDYPGTQRYYFAGNVMPGVFDETNQEIGRTPNGAQEKEYDEKFYKQWLDKPFFPSYAKIESAREAYKSVLSDVGATMPVLDDHDVRVIDETLHGTYHYVGSRSGHYGLIDSEEDCGGFEDYGNEVIDLDAFDTDRDGLPNWWEKLLGTNPESPANDFSDSNADPDGDGFTYLDEYLDWMSVPHYYISSKETKSIDLAPYFLAYTKNPVYSVNSVEELAATIEGNVLKLDVAKNFKLPRFIEVSVKDADNSSYTRRIAVCMENDVNDALSQVVSKNAFSVYPSFFSSSLSVLNHTQSAVRLVLSDLNGKTLMSQSTDAHEIEMSGLATLPSQVYVLSMYDAQSGALLGVQKVVKR